MRAVVDLELEVRHGGPLELGGVRVPELVGVHAAAAEEGVLGVSFTTFSATTLAVLSCLRSQCLSSMKPAIKGLRAKR